MAAWGIDPELVPAASPVLTFFDGEAHPKTKKLKLNETRKIFFIPLGRRVVRSHAEINLGDGETE